MEEKSITEEMDEFSEYLKKCTNSQVREVYFKERNANRRHFAILARAEADKRGVQL